jgi:hypothetical protein
MLVNAGKKRLAPFAFKSEGLSEDYRFKKLLAWL